jgi:hypothetical protein
MPVEQHALIWVEQRLFDPIALQNIAIFLVPDRQEPALRVVGGEFASEYSAACCILRCGGCKRCPLVVGEARGLDYPADGL